MNRDQKIWLSIGFTGYTIGLILLILADFYNMRFRYGIYILLSALIVAFWSIIMYALTEYMSTKEIISILIKKIKESKMKKEQKVWLLISIFACVIFMITLFGAHYEVRFKYGLYILISSAVITFWSFVMYVLTQYLSTKEILSIMAEKARQW